MLLEFCIGQVGFSRFITLFTCLCWFLDLVQAIGLLGLVPVALILHQFFLSEPSPLHLHHRLRCASVLCLSFQVLSFGLERNYSSPSLPASKVTWSFAWRPVNYLQVIDPRCVLHFILGENLGAVLHYHALRIFYFENGLC